MTHSAATIPAQTRILHLEDSPVDASLVCTVLQTVEPTVSITVVETGQAYEGQLEAGEYDIILSDYLVPSYGGEVALRRARERQPGLPFVFVSGALGEEIAIEAMKLGATDYVVKERIQRLPSVVARALAEKAERTQRRMAERALMDSEAKFRHLAESVPALIWVADADGRCKYLSQTWPGREANGPLGDWLDAVHGDDRPKVAEVYAKSLSDRTPFVIQHRLIDRHNKARCYTNSAVPQFSADGTFVGLTGSLLDITERQLFQERLEQKAEEFQTLAENIHQLAWMADSTGWIYWYNKRWFDYTGTKIADMQGWGWKSVHHPDHVDRVVEKISRHFASGEDWEDTFPLRSEEGEYRWFLSRARCVRDGSGAVVRWLGTNTDITERLNADRQRRVLLHELNHRVKNSLATVRAIAGQTLRTEHEIGSFKEKFEARLLALSAAHDLLTQESWRGAELTSLIRATLRLQDDERRLSLDGPNLELSPRVALAVAMALHELATNALKHGAWSSDRGEVRVTWQVDGDCGYRFVLTWQEHGGPSVTAPSREGFGSRLIKRSLASELDGTVNVDYAASGLRCTIHGCTGQAEELEGDDDDV